MNIGELANGGGHGRGNPPARRRPAAGGTRTLFGLGQQAGITGGKKYAIFSGFRSLLPTGCGPTIFWVRHQPGTRARYVCGAGATTSPQGWMAERSKALV